MGLEEIKRAYGLGTKRAEDDFYATRPQDVEILLRHEKFHGMLWEPACGDGAICRVLAGHGYKFIATDLVDRGYPGTLHGLDFTDPEHCGGTAASIITNPPYRQAEKFVRRALEIATDRVCMLLRLQFLEGKRRLRLWQETPIARFYIFSNRIGFTKEGVPHDGGMIAYMWAVWQHGHSGPPIVRWVNSELNTTDE
jgi:hypothetical protein